MAILLDRGAWLLGEARDDWPRSRYSGVALCPGLMAITVIVSWVELFGHSYIALEWFGDEVPGPRASQRRHEVYHLCAEPTDAERAHGINDPGSLQLVSLRTRAARVDRETELDFFPRYDGGGRPLPAYFQGWLVPFADGWRARESAVVAMARPPRYNYLELSGGKNCARWAIEVAALAEIDVGHWLSSLVAVPKRLVRPHEAIEEEDQMWQRRNAGRASG